MAKYTFRFHTHGWTDISVNAKNEQEAYAKADAKYNSGDYPADAEKFENTEVEKI